MRDMENDLRRWMTLVENGDDEPKAPFLTAWADEVGRRMPRKSSNDQPKQKFKSGRLADFYEQVLRDGGDMFGADESELSMDEVKEWVATHRKLFQNGGITVYRTMQLTAEQFAHLKPGDELGNHWTYEFDEHNVEGFDISLKDRTKGLLYVFEAKVRTGEVAFPLTVAYNVYFPHEKEIFLYSRLAQPKLVSVRYLDTHTFTLGDENLRPDLVGVEMRA
jgi:hypothetical protein